jgi:hypothetical protein
VFRGDSMLMDASQFRDVARPAAEPSPDRPAGLR